MGQSPWRHVTEPGRAVVVARRDDDMVDRNPEFLPDSLAYLGGVTGLDEINGGGLPRGRTTLRSGKTILRLVSLPSSEDS